VRRQAWLACVALCACVAPESGNPTPRCNQTSECAAELICYRSFCVEDEQDPVSEPDAGAPLNERDAEPEVDAVVVDASVVAAQVVDASQPDAAIVDAGASDAAGNDAGTDAGPRDAGQPADAALPCAMECRPRGQNSAPCRKCVKKVFGDEPEKLCGKYDDDDEDDDKALAGLRDPICVALCLGAAIQDPSCGPQLFCHGSKCGGLP
jgi:hypothetical protein